MPESSAPPPVIRVGSPFRIDPPVVRIRAEAAQRMRRQFERGVMQFTYNGSLIASALVLGLAVPAIWGFPLGAALISGLGGFLAMFGLWADYPRLAFGLLVVHVCLFVFIFMKNFLTEPMTAVIF